ncbi:hypothetical protein HGRIS_011978 [Hohenbuehelia grisea]|uniref:Uncharacterized protein n=1 Tax=Hohenbuehelia grisea TaxID=104357 RepID=A0ABR3JXL6_9AGAR
MFAMYHHPNGLVSWHFEPPGPVAPQLVYDLQAGFDSWYIKGDVVWVPLRNEWYPGIVMDVFFMTNRKTGPFYRVDRSGQVSSDYELHGDDSRRLDNPTCYLYHVSRLDQGTLGGALVVMPTTCTKKPRAGFAADLVSAPGLRAELAVQSGSLA